MKFIYQNKAHSIDEFRRIQTDERWVIDIQSFLNLWFEESKYLNVKTSGSTGTPKDIQLPKSSFKTSAAITNSFFNLKEESNALLCLPIRYIAGKLMVIRALEAGFNLYLEKPESMPVISANKLDFAAMTPLQVERLLNNAPERLSKIKTLIIGGGAISNVLFKKIVGLEVPQCFQTYGMTETLTHIAVQRINGAYAQPYFEVLPQFAITMDDRDCLIIKADHIANQQVITNDRVELVDQTHFKWLGRVDNIINSGGIKISPESVESKISDFIKSPFFIAGKDDLSLGKKVTLCVESPPWSAARKAVLLKELEDHLNKYEIPRSILFFDCFLYTPTGKIQREKTLAQDASE